MKYLGINLTKHEVHAHWKLKNIAEQNQRLVSGSLLERYDIVKMLLVPNRTMWVLSHFSHDWLFVTLWTVTHQAPLPMEFYRQEYWSGLPFLSPGDLSHSGIKSMSPALQANSLTQSHQGNPTDPKTEHIFRTTAELLRKKQACS